MLPTNANSFSRSTYYSQSCPSSKMATRVSCGFAEITISFDIYTPHGASDGGGTHASAEQDDSLNSARRAAQERLLKLCVSFPHRCLPDLKIEFRPAVNPRLVYRFKTLNHFLIQNLRAQLTKRRMRTFITSPKAKNTKAVADPP